MEWLITILADMGVEEAVKSAYAWGGLAGLLTVAVLFLLYRPPAALMEYLKDRSKRQTESEKRTLAERESEREQDKIKSDQHKQQLLTQAQECRQHVEVLTATFREELVQEREHRERQAAQSREDREKANRECSEANQQILLLLSEYRRDQEWNSKLIRRLMRVRGLTIPKKNNQGQGQSPPTPPS